MQTQQVLARFLPILAHLGWRTQCLTNDRTGRCFSKTSGSWGKKDQCLVQYYNDLYCRSHSLAANYCLLPVSESDKAGRVSTEELYMALNRHLGMVYSRLQWILFGLIAVEVQFCNDSYCRSRSLAATCCLLSVRKSDKGGKAPTEKLCMALIRHLRMVHCRLYRILFCLLAIMVLDGALG